MQGILLHNYKKDMNIKELKFPYNFGFKKKIVPTFNSQLKSPSYSTSSPVDENFYVKKSQETNWKSQYIEARG